MQLELTHALQIYVCYFGASVSLFNGYFIDFIGYVDSLKIYGSQKFVFFLTIQVIVKMVIIQSSTLPDFRTTSQLKAPNYINILQVFACGWFKAFTLILYLHLKPGDFKLTEGANPCYDYLQFYDGPSAESASLGEYCITTHPQVIFFNWTILNLIEKHHLGDWSPEKDCCLRLTFRQPVRKPSSESSDIFRTALIRHHRTQEVR